MSGAIDAFYAGVVARTDRSPGTVSSDGYSRSGRRADEIETGVVDGVNLLVMDMAKCIRCGNCSLACHKVHGHSRLVRRGIHIERPFKPHKPADAKCACPDGLHALPGPGMSDRLSDRGDRTLSKRRDRHQCGDLHRLRRLRDAMSVRRDLDDRAARMRKMATERALRSELSVFSLGEGRMPRAGHANRKPARREMQPVQGHRP